jgi:ABC-type transport system involved in cytochrome c biogenesis permease subunit
MKKNNLQHFLLILFCLFPLEKSHAQLAALPVQDSGRVKPFDTFARDTLRLVWGKESYNGKDATDIVFSWMIVPEEWQKTEIVLVRHAGLREAMGLDAKRLHYSAIELLTNSKIGPLIQELKTLSENQEKLNPFQQAVQTLENQLSMFQAVQLGLAIRVLPKKEDTTWVHIAEMQEPWKSEFASITKTFVNHLAALGKGESGSIEKNALEDAVQSYVKKVEAEFGDYSNQKKIGVELLLNKSHPFRWSWALYLLASIFFAFAYFGSRPQYMKWAWALTGSAMLLQIIGVLMRSFILDRAPVTNMFETVVWVAFITVIFAGVLYKWLKIKILPLGATITATLCLILTDLSSHVLDKSLTPLEPVLRDNFWLLTHVVIIVSSYGAFFLAFVIGDILLYYFYKDEAKYDIKIKEGVQAIYRAIQIGVVLLAAGTILGGIWADYSWGRFWGWDPKETWALIALLGYLAILHARLKGLVKNFGMTIWSILSFSLIIMAWYGVNFVLGAGLHTYGFGAGGVEYVAGFVAIHILAVVFVAAARHNRAKPLKS